MAPTDYGAVFQRLRAILQRSAAQMVIKTDTNDTYYVDTPHIQKNKTPLFFGAAQIKKNYVSYHLFPVYMFPDLLSEISPELRKRMQGKACFNFTRVEEPLFEEITRLTEAGRQRFVAEGYLS